MIHDLHNLLFLYRPTEERNNDKVVDVINSEDDEDIGGNDGSPPVLDIDPNNVNPAEDNLD